MHTTDRTQVRGFLAFLVILGAGLGFLAGTHVGADSVTERPSVVVHEGDPGWDCATMGNRQCGPADVSL